uniref:Signal peptide peptidase-like 3 n=1 Tax=Phallusia mammillata TaxID=59560 RepID=A0A6F9DWL1_9ASCI|nr:signal peptide peptidase-like 3 [Phallusia mammillata]
MSFKPVHESCCRCSRQRRSSSFFNMRCVGYLLCLIFVLLLIQQASAQDNVQALAVDEIGRIPPQQQNNLRAKQINGNNVKGIPVSVSFPKGDYQWAFSLMDSSRISTFVIAILLIVYGSFRSLNMENEVGGKDKSVDGTNSDQSTFQMINSTQAVCLPIGASVSLLIMFFFFDSMQLVFAICTAVLAASAFAFLMLPMCQYIMRPCSSPNKLSLGFCGRFTPAELLSLSLSILFVSIWVFTGHWLLMDALSMGLCVSMIALLRLPSLKVSCLLLSGLLIYDVFWVFFSSYIFNANVMVQVATAQAENPVGVLARKFNFAVAKDAPQLSLPGKLVFPNSMESGFGSEHFSMLGLGDIVMPGLLLCFVLRYDNYKKRKLEGEMYAPSSPGNLIYRVRYFHCTLIGYFIGLVTATIASEVNSSAQPALLYLVPFTLLPLITMAYIKGDLKQMWNTPFKAVTQRFMEV